MLAVAAFLCCFETGHCTALAGLEGAYSTYEAELRMRTKAMMQEKILILQYKAAIKEADVKFAAMTVQLDELVCALMRSMLPVVSEIVKDAKALYVSTMEQCNEDIAV